MGWNPCPSLTGNTVVGEDPCIETAIATFEEGQGVGSLRARGRPRGSATDSSLRSLLWDGDGGYDAWTVNDRPFNIPLSLVVNNMEKIPVTPSPAPTSILPQRRAAMEKKA